MPFPGSGSHRSLVVLGNAQAAAQNLPEPARKHSRMTTLDRITLDPEVMGGMACIRGLRVTVGTVLGLLAAQRSEREILEAYPYLEEEDLRAALSYAALRVSEREGIVRRP